jgi:hypothetical protein
LEESGQSDAGTDGGYGRRDLDEIAARQGFLTALWLL